jgi:hypothetical protein
MSYEIDWEKNGVIVRFSGVIDFKTNISANNELYSDQRCEDLKYIIWDTSGVSEATISDTELTIIASQDQLGSSRLQKIRMALFAPADHIRILCDQYCAKHQSRLTGWEFLVSTDMEEIRKWTSS